MDYPVVNIECIAQAPGQVEEKRLQINPGKMLIRFKLHKPTLAKRMKFLILFNVAKLSGRYPASFILLNE